MTNLSLLFVSRRCSLRSALAQACMRHVAPDRFVVRTCGIPGSVADSIDPAALDALRAAHIQSSLDAPRGWQDYERGGVQARIDLVVILDHLAAERQPAWPGQPEIAYWLFPDAVGGARSLDASLQILHALRRRLDILANLPLRIPDRAALRSDLIDLAHLL